MRRLLAGMLVLALETGAASTTPVVRTGGTTSPSTDAEYQLDAGDKLRVIVFGADELGGEFTIGSSGSVALPLIGEVPAGGLSLGQFRQKVTAALADGYVKSPRVSVEVLNYRPFYILGEVNKPGEYPYAKGLTILSAVAQAQGFTYRASTHKVMVRHAQETAEREEPLTASTSVMPGDVIRVRERWF